MKWRRPDGPTDPRILAAEEELRELVSRQRRAGSQLLDLCNRRDTYRDELRRRPGWIDSEDQWEEYRRQLRARLTEAEGMIEFHEATLTKGAEAIAEIDRRIAALERRGPATVASPPGRQPSLFRH